jgi:pantoate--beta-alanine ligase
MPIEVLSTVAEVRAWRARGEAATAGAASVGAVPTMGFLHEGHLSLVRRARTDNDRVVASIFVNPTQFGPSEDLTSYPRDLSRDLQLLAGAGCDMAFVPSDEEMYPAGFDTWVEVGAVAAPLEGERRPGHFRGVATVVMKLLQIISPTRAYFGEKDAQQLAVIRAMVRDLDVPTEVVACATVREPDGLAKSSRNTYLGPEQRTAATVLYRALTSARRAWERGERSAEALRRIMLATLSSESLAQVDYVSVADPDTMQELAVVPDEAILSLAVRIGRARLIDNVRVGGK